MSDNPGTQYLAAIGIKRKGDVGFRTKGRLRPIEPTPADPHLIHGGKGIKHCSNCGQTVNHPTGSCFTCPHCLIEHGGCS